MPEVEPEDYRSPFRRDYARLIHSPAFRRLQGKTQLFPGAENDFFRNRLTHSLEVAQVAKSIANKINYEVPPFCDDSKFKIDTDLVEFAGLAHDLGHPPFGHNGEAALDERMRPFGGFEGNAQTLRLLARLEKKVRDSSAHDTPVGLNLTYRSLAAILKYDQVIPEERTTVGVKKGYYYTEKDLVRRIKEKVVGDSRMEGFKTIECYIMDIADDISYATYDLEDSLKAGFFNLIDLLNLPNDPSFNQIASQVWRRVYRQDGGRASPNSKDLEKIKVKVWVGILDLLQTLLPSGNNGDVENLTKVLSDEGIPVVYRESLLSAFVYEQSLLYQKDGHIRTQFTSSLVGRFINAIEVKINEEMPLLSKVDINKETKILIESLKIYTYEKHILSPRLKVTEYRGKGFISDIFDALNNEGGHMVMPEDWKNVFQSASGESKKCARIICDFIAGMTDRYALEFYGRLFSENPQTIFKDI